MIFIAAFVSCGLLSKTVAFIPPTCGRRPLGLPASVLSVATIDVSRHSAKTLARDRPWTQQIPFDQETEWDWVHRTVESRASSSYVLEPHEIEGSVPTDLKGTYRKVGPGNFERNGVRYSHTLDGDGFVAAVSFGQNVSYTGRYVETEYFLREQATDQILFRNVFGTQPSNPFKNVLNVELKNVANTNILQWGGKLWVLWEGGRPYELNPDNLKVLSLDGDGEFGPLEHLGQPNCKLRGVTLDNGGVLDQAAGMGRSFGAHPHVDGDRLVGIKAGLNPITDAVQMEFCSYDSNWKQEKSRFYDLPGSPSAPHDFCLSENYYLVLQNRIDLNNLPFILGIKSPSQVLELNLRKPTILHIVPKDSDKAAIRVELPPYFNLHSVPRAVETDDGKLVLYTNGWDLTDKRFFPTDQDKVPFLGAWGGRYPNFDHVPPSLLFETVVDLQTQSVLRHEELVEGLVMEFPTQDEQGRVYCCAGNTDNESLPGTGFCQIDLQAPDTHRIWYAGPKTFCGEITPVSKRNGEQGSWLLGYLYDYSGQRTTLAIFDSERFMDGPVCRIHLRSPLAWGLHGSFAEAR